MLSGFSWKVHRRRNNEHCAALAAAAVKMYSPTAYLVKPFQRLNNTAENLFQKATSIASNTAQIYNKRLTLLERRLKDSRAKLLTAINPSGRVTDRPWMLRVPVLCCAVRCPYA